MIFSCFFSTGMADEEQKDELSALRSIFDTDLAGFIFLGASYFNHIFMGVPGIAGNSCYRFVYFPFDLYTQ